MWFLEQAASENFVCIVGGMEFSPFFLLALQWDISNKVG